MKWTLPLTPKNSTNALEITENKPAPKHGFFAQYIRELEKKDDWDEVTGKFRIFRNEKCTVEIELDTEKDLPPFRTIGMD